ncbi:hypothetical protein COCCADRAFT_80679, partial [Bipolaris zeicola 26-R-13]
LHVCQLPSRRNAQLITLLTLSPRALRMLGNVVLWCVVADERDAQKFGEDPAHRSLSTHPLSLG